MKENKKNENVEKPAPKKRAYYRPRRKPKAPAEEPAVAILPAKETATATAKKEAKGKKGRAKAAIAPAPAPAPAPTPSAKRIAPKPAKASKRSNGPKLRFFPLGGVSEIGKNMFVYECGNDIIVVDSGVAFPDEEMPGIDLVIPDISYLEKNADKVRGIVLTHGHEDHIGALPYVLRTLHVPVYGGRLTLGILENKFEEHKMLKSVDLHEVHPGSVIQLGCFTVEFIHANHSIADAMFLAITTPQGLIIHSSDFKIDSTPIAGEMTDLTRLGELGRQGVLALMMESTNVERPGYSPSERKVGASLKGIFHNNPDKRIIIATFSSNVFRVQQIVNAAVETNRKVAVVGRSMTTIVGAAIRLGYMHVPEGVLIDAADVRKYPPHQVTVISTGSQGEPMSALSRMAFSDHNNISIDANDVVVLSSTAIPGNEKLVGRVINELFRLGATVVYDSVAEVHVSGHACQEELKMIHALVKPTYFIPIHGEYRHLRRHCDLAQECGMSADRIFLPDLGRVLEFDNGRAVWNGTVPAGKILVDGLGVGDVGNIVLRDRKLLSQDGLILVVASIDEENRLLVAGPDIISRGFVYVRENEDLMDRTKELAKRTLEEALDDRRCDRAAVKLRVKDALAKYIFSQTKRRPMILPVIMDV
ncbi:MAG: ribonuclease J [Clostridia bacterium]|nr:ribonuclease J [Clostridia bacterium]